MVEGVDCSSADTSAAHNSVQFQGLHSVKQREAHPQIPLRSVL